MIKDVGLLKAENKKNGNKREIIMLSHSVTKNSLKTDKYMTAIPTLVCIFVFTALIYCTLCSDCRLAIFLSFQTVLCMCDRVS